MGGALITGHINKLCPRHRTGQEDIRGIELKQGKLTDGQMSRGVTVLQLLPASELDSSGQLHDLLGTTRVPVLEGDCPLS